MSEEQLEFVHRFLPADETGSTRTLLLLHGTGGDETDLIPLGRMLVGHTASLLSPRGRVLENGMPRFFRRIAEGVFDTPDLIKRTHELASFIEKAAARYSFDQTRLFAVGYSNGANIAASLLLLRSGVLKGAVLFHPMVPLVPETLPDLSGTPVFIGAGRLDPIARPENTEQLVQMLEEAKADVETYWHEGGHTLTGEEAAASKTWLANHR